MDKTIFYYLFWVLHDMERHNKGLTEQQKGHLESSLNYAFDTFTEEEIKEFWENNYGKR